MGLNIYGLLFKSGREKPQGYSLTFATLKKEIRAEVSRFLKVATSQVNRAMHSDEAENRKKFQQERRSS